MGEFLVANERNVSYALFNETGDIVNVTLIGYDFEPRGDASKPHYFVSVHINGATAYTTDQFYGGAGNTGDAREAFGMLAGYMNDESDRYRGSGKMGAATPDDGWIFGGGQISEWCHANAESIYADIAAE